MRGPTAWVLEADGSIECIVSCRDCAWSAMRRQVPEESVRETLDALAKLYAAHKHAGPSAANIIHAAIRDAELKFDGG
jgi:hypothetical protein